MTFSPDSSKIFVYPIGSDRELGASPSPPVIGFTIQGATAIEKFEMPRIVIDAFAISESPRLLAGISGSDLYVLNERMLSHSDASRTSEESALRWMLPGNIEDYDSDDPLKFQPIPLGFMSVSSPSVAISRDGRWIAVSSNAPRPAVELLHYDAETPGSIVPDLEQIGIIRDLRFSPNGRYLAIVGTQINVFDIEKDETVLRFDNRLREGFITAAFSKEGDSLTAIRPNEARVWNIGDAGSKDVIRRLCESLTSSVIDDPQSVSVVTAEPICTESQMAIEVEPAYDWSAELQ